ncbi:MAG TPA: acyl-CoA synthetase, partial [Longimicrobiales bacterium]|nr:acyl-CoA synthetase [Longimicrobiales bacterium]
VGTGGTREYTFGHLAELSNRLANALGGLGITKGDRVGVVLPQRVEAGLTHLAVYKLGAIALPLSGLFGPEALEYRLGDSEAKAVVTDARSLDKVAAVTEALGSVTVICVDDPVAAPHQSFWHLLHAGQANFSGPATGPDTPGLLIYTSGTTGPPKGALHGHRVLLGHLPGYELMFGFFPRPGDVVWTPADWAWIGGLMDALMPAWYHGRPVVGAARGGFDPDWALDLITEHQVTASFLPPTALKMMRQAATSPRRLPLRAVMSGGEPLGEELLSWAWDNLGVRVNEIFGQTEANLLVGNSASAWEVRPGSMGRAYPGHEVAIVDGEGEPVPPEEVGEIAVRRPDPVMFLEYWRRPDATEAKFKNDWLLTGDLGRIDEEGYFWFHSRADDVITSAGYRIGPTEIEECLMGHPAVAMAAAIGVPDQIRGHVVKAFVKAAPGATPGTQLEEEIKDLVRHRLAAYEYPRYVEFVDELPLTTTGKIMRSELRRREEQRQSSQ